MAIRVRAFCRIGALVLVSAAMLLGTLRGRADAACSLGNPNIKNIVYVEFDNVHFTRDNPNVPSDVEQMPNLLNFLEQNGTLDSANHAILISHTANDILTTQTGLYSDHHGINVSNSFGVFGPPPSKGNLNVYNVSAFFYWTDLVQDINPSSRR